MLLVLSSLRTIDGPMIKASPLDSMMICSPSEKSVVSEIVSVFTSIWNTKGTEYQRLQFESCCGNDTRSPPSTAREESDRRADSTPGLAPKTWLRFRSAASLHSALQGVRAKKAASDVERHATPPRTRSVPRLTGMRRSILVDVRQVCLRARLQAAQGALAWLAILIEATGLQLCKRLTIANGRTHPSKAFLSSGITIEIRGKIRSLRPARCGRRVPLSPTVRGPV